MLEISARRKGKARLLPSMDGVRSTLIIGIDASLRSTGIVAISNHLGGMLHDFKLINLGKEYDGEDLILAQAKEITDFVIKNNHDLDGVAIEGLSFGSVGSRKDLIAGVFWGIRTFLRFEFPNIPIGAVPVSAWRSKVLDKLEQQACKKSGEKNALKLATVEKLPAGVRDAFKLYVNRTGAKRDAIFDLADAYWIARYRLSLEGS